MSQLQGSSLLALLQGPGGPQMPDEINNATGQRRRPPSAWTGISPEDYRRIATGGTDSPWELSQFVKMRDQGGPQAAPDVGALAQALRGGKVPAPDKPMGPNGLPPSQLDQGGKRFPNATEAMRSLGQQFPNEQAALSALNDMTVKSFANRMRNAPDVLPPGQVRDVTDQYQQGPAADAVRNGTNGLPLGASPASVGTPMNAGPQAAVATLGNGNPQSNPALNDYAAMRDALQKDIGNNQPTMRPGGIMTLRGNTPNLEYPLIDPQYAEWARGEQAKRGNLAASQEALQAMPGMAHARLGAMELALKEKQFEEMRSLDADSKRKAMDALATGNTGLAQDILSGARALKLAHGEETPSNPLQALEVKVPGLSGYAKDKTPTAGELVGYLASQKGDKWVSENWNSVFPYLEQKYGTGQAASSAIPGFLQRVGFTGMSDPYNTMTASEQLGNTFSSVQTPTSRGNQLIRQNIKRMQQQRK